MSFSFQYKMPTVDELQQQLPCSAVVTQAKASRDRLLADVFTRRIDKFLVIVGPCSAHDEDAVCEYIDRLAAVQEKVAEKLVLVPRVYTNKPRTTGEGYKGMAHQPDTSEKPDVVAGLEKIRAMHLRIISATGLSAADEMLYPDSTSYLSDVLSYIAVGARSVENQQHRLVASGIDVPVGMKNPTGGDIKVMLHSIYAAQIPHVFIYNNWQVETPGNPLAHAILRGAVNQYSRAIPNYHYEDLVRIGELYQERNLKNPAIVIDVNHANSGKQYNDQPRITREILVNRNNNSLLKEMVRGVMIESFLVEGSQPFPGTTYGQSITDPCLGWESTEMLLYEMADMV